MRLPLKSKTAREKDGGGGQMARGGLARTARERPAALHSHSLKSSVLHFTFEFVILNLA